MCPPDIPDSVCGTDCGHAHWEKGFAVYTPLDLDRKDKAGEGYSTRPGAMVGRYLQSFKYFEPIKDQLREVLQFSSNLAENTESYRHEILQRMYRDVIPPSFSLVGIAIRRGDILGLDSVELPPDKYFELAMSKLEEAHGNPDNVIFVVVASEEESRWVQSQSSFASRGERVVFAWPHTANDAGGGGGDALDFALLASCHHIITTTGSFGWWAGWISGGTVVYYRDQFNMTNVYHERHTVLDDYWPEDWVGITGADLGFNRTSISD